MTAGKSQECHICLEELRQGLVACPCGHVYHHACIIQALQVNHQCPICRRHVLERHLITLYFDVPAATASAAACVTASPTPTVRTDTNVKKLHDRVTLLIERLQWQKKQYDQLAADMTTLRTQNDQLHADKQTLMQRIHAMEQTKTELMNRMVKCQSELKRQVDANRQSAVNQSIIDYLNTCDGDVLEEEIQNPRELIAALKKACKFRHDQYQKVVKEKMRLKHLLQQQQITTTVDQNQSNTGNTRVATKFKPSKPPTAEEYPAVYKKRRREEEKPLEVASLRSNAYSDIPIARSAPSRSFLSRSSHNPSQYGVYKLTPSTNAAVAMASDRSGTICRRGYDATGNLTTFFMPQRQRQPKPPSSMRPLMNWLQKKS